MFYDSLNVEWKEIIKWNCIGLDTEQTREKVFDTDYVPTKTELDKIDTLNELWINWWENDPPSDDYGVSDLSPIAKFKNVKSLVIRSLNIEDYSPISTCINLKSLIIQFSKTTNVDFLKNLFSLENLDLRYNPISDIRPLYQLINLTSLDLSSTDIEDITSLTNLKELQSLSLSYTKIKTLTSLSGLKKLKELWLRDSGITSIQPLFRLNLEQLILNNVNVSDDEVATFVEIHPKCRVFFKGQWYNDNNVNIDLPF